MKIVRNYPGPVLQIIGPRAKWFGAALLFSYFYHAKPKIVSQSIEI